MNHLKHYNLLIQKSKHRKIVDGVYYEKHHIIPKSRGGSNKKDNIATLTAREHFVAHMLLAHIYGGGLWQAVLMMRNDRFSRRAINSRLYACAKKNWVNTLKGKPRPAHVIEALRIGVKNAVWSDERRASVSARTKGKKRTGSPEAWKWNQVAKDSARERMLARAPKYLFKGEMLSYAEAAIKYGLTKAAIKQRVHKLKMSFDEAVSLPMIPRGISRKSMYNNEAKNKV